MKRHEMSDEQWTALEPLLPVNIGRRWSDHRQVINGILWVLNTGAAWRDMPERFGPWYRPLASAPGIGPWPTIYHRFNSWTKDGLWQRISQALLAKLNRQRQVEWDLVAIDATHIRASRAAAGARKKGQRPDTTRSGNPEGTRRGTRRGTRGPRTRTLTRRFHHEAPSRLHDERAAIGGSAQRRTIA